MSEVDLAMQYSDERKRSAHLEQRLFGLMFEIVPYLMATNRLLEEIITQKSEAATQTIKMLVEWQSDIETALMVNFFQPAGRSKLINLEKLRQVKCLADLPMDTVDTIHDILLIAVKEVRIEWDTLAEEHRLLSAAQMCKRNKQRVMKLIDRQSKIQAANQH